MTFGERLKKALDRRAISRRTLANAAGITEAHVSHLVRSGRDQARSIATLIKMARLLDVSIEWLALGEPPEPDFEGLTGSDPYETRGRAISIARGEVPEPAIEAARKEMVHRTAYGWILRIQALAQLYATEAADTARAKPKTTAVPPSTPLAPTQRSGSKTSKKRA